MTSTSNNFNAANLGAKALSLVLAGQSLIDFTKGVMGSKFFESSKQSTVKKMDTSDSFAQRLQHIAQGCLYAIAAFALYSYNSESQGILQNCQHDFTKTENDLGICKFNLTGIKHQLNESETSLAKLTGLEEQFNNATLVIQALQSQILGNSTLVSSLNQTLALCQTSVREQEANLQQIQQTERNNTRAVQTHLDNTNRRLEALENEKSQFESNANLNITQLKNQVDQLTADYQSTLQERDGCMEAYNSTVVTNLAQSYINGNLTVELKELAQKNSKLEAQLSICNSSNYQIANENDEQGYKIGNLTQSLNQVNQEKSELESSLSTCNANYSQIATLNEEQGYQIGNLTQSLNQVNQEKSELESSLSTCNANYSQIAIANQEQGYQIGNLTAKLAAHESPKTP